MHPAQAFNTETLVHVGRDCLVAAEVVVAPLDGLFQLKAAETQRSEFQACFFFFFNFFFNQQ